MPYWMPFAVTIFMGMYAHIKLGFLYPSRLGLLAVYYIMWTAITIVPLFSADDFAYRSGFEDMVWAMVLHPVFFFSFYVFGVMQFTSLKKRKNFFRQSIDFTDLERVYQILWWISVLILIHQLLTIRNIPLVGMLTGISGEQLALNREEAFKLNDSFSKYLWNFNRQIFFPVLTILAYYRYFYFQKNSKGLSIFIFTLFLAILNNALSSALAPVALIGVYLMLIRVVDKGKINVMTVALGFVLIIFFPAMADYLYSESQEVSLIDSLSTTLHKIYIRFSYETFERSLYYFDVFPHVKDYLEGRANRLIATLTGQDWFNLQNYVFLYIVNKDAEHLQHGSANAHFIGYMYADFALKGVVIASIIFGYLVGVVEGIYVSMKKNFLNISCYIISVAVFWKFMGTQPTTIFISHGIILMLLMSLFFKNYLVQKKRL